MQKKCLGRKRIAAFTLCLFMLIPTMSSSADSISETENRIAELQSEKAELDSKLASLKDDESKALEYQATLQEKITNVESQIDEAIIQIETLDGEILVLEAKLAKSEEEMGDTLDRFYASVKSLYKSGSNEALSTLEILLDSNSLYEFSMKTQAMQKLSEYNLEITEKITAYVEATQDERTQCQEKKEEVAELKRGFEANQAELDDLYTENQAALLEIQRLGLETETQISQNQSESEELSAQLQQLIAEENARLEAQAKAEAEAAEKANNSGGGSADNDGGSGGGSSGGSDTGSSGGGTSSGYNSDSGGGGSSSSGSTSYTWPIPGVYTVTQYFSSSHKGMDIAGDYGTAIVAAESGTVIAANDYDEWGDSWGYYVLVAHNSTYTTRYAHLSSLAVSYGQSVSRGQTIGYEGNTGNSTGPHLHFEVYQNGTRIDPRPFIGG